MPRLSATERAPAAVHTRPADSSASHPWAARGDGVELRVDQPEKTPVYVLPRTAFATAEFIARTDSPNGTTGHPEIGRPLGEFLVRRHAQHAPPRRVPAAVTASPSSGSTPPRESYVDNNTRIPLLLVIPTSCAETD